MNHQFELARTASRFIKCLLLSFVITLAGCEGRDVAEAQPRQSPFVPEFDLAKKLDAEEIADVAESNNSIDLSFLHDDHFAGVHLNLTDIIEHPEFAEIPWEKLEDQLAQLVGDSNARLANISQVWMLLDRENVNLEAAQSGNSPVVFVLRLLEPVNEEALDHANSNRTVSKISDADNAFSGDVDVLVIDPLTLAIGPKRLAEKLTSARGPTTQIGKRFSQLTLDASLSAVIVIEPVRSLLESVAGMAAGMTGERSSMPGLVNALDHVEITVSLDQPDLVVAFVHLQDETLVKDLGKLLDESLNSGSSPTFASPFGNRTPELMIPFESTGAWEAVLKEIKDKSLLTVSTGETEVSLKLRRPENLNNVIRATIVDAEKQVKLAQRVERMRAVADALAEFESAEGSLPAPASKLGDGERHPFSWRVAILPQLGEQDLYDQFDFSQPWDSEHNLEVARQIPEVFQRVDDESGSNQSVLHIPVGNRSAVTGDDSRAKLSELKDKSIWTAVVLEGAPSTGQVWTQPGGLAVDDLGDSSFGQEDENGVLIITAAFKTRIVKKGTPLAESLTASGGETMTRSDFLDDSIGN